MPENPQITLRDSGERAVLMPDPYQPGALILEVDGTPQSHVFLEAQDELFFEYIRRIGHVIDLFRPAGEPITAVHLGGGALTLPRYVALTRSGSRQQVLERHADLIDFVREHAPLPAGASIRFRYGDARATLAKLPAGLRGTVDLVVLDIFAGARTPAHVTSREFFGEVAALLSPDGIIVINVADGPGLSFARAQVATLASVLPEVIVIAEAQVLKGRRFGNLVLVGSRSVALLDMLPRLLAGGPHPASALSGAEIIEFVANAPIVTDATAIPSPSPNKNIFAIKR
ncbi:MAG: spermine synthase [Microbacteriaceae bacterium]|nr:spermine synthase [Microbacteriaceae bacterium]